ncbi:MAG: glycosyltransferase family 1 protein [Planctomycetes bacterium]|nr:glycosyltransferase family 1 protein [Planctomycetota bacterium]
MTAVAHDPVLAENDATLTNNLRSLDVHHPQTAQHIRDARVSDTMLVASGRDGATTFTWTDDAGVTQWLGRTSMPTISIPALLETFQPGLGNVLLHPFGHGLEARLLLDRTLRHQAIFIVDADAAAVRVTLSLTDLHDGFDTGRLHVFTGERAWEEFEAFLIENPGYLSPDRVLARPWFGRTDVHELTNRLSAIAMRVSNARAAQSAPTPNTLDLLILSNVASPRTLDAAANIRTAAAALGWACDALVPDSPARMESNYVQRCIDAANPGTTMIIDTAPDRMNYRLPPGPRVMFLTTDVDIETQQAADLFACVDSNNRRDALLRAGWAADHVFVVPPAASLHATTHAARRGHRIALIGNRPDPSPEAAGLNLQSHQHIWRVVGELLRADGLPNAADLLARTEKKLGVRLESEHVRAGLIQRIEMHLLPNAAHDAAVAALAGEGIEVAACGTGWNAIPMCTPDDIGLAIITWPDRDAVCRALDLLAMGIPVAAAAEMPWPPDFDTSLVFTFATPDELAPVATDFVKNPSAALERANRARAHVIAQHTWLTRLRDLANALRLSTRAPL